MDSRELSREQISAWSDGELLPEQIPAALAALLEEDARQDWEIYQLIGVVLRAEDDAPVLRPNVTNSIFARLDAEPARIATAALPEESVTRVPWRLRYANSTFVKCYGKYGLVLIAVMSGYAIMHAHPALMTSMRDCGFSIVGEVPALVMKKLAHTIEFQAK